MSTIDERLDAVEARLDGAERRMRSFAGVASEADAELDQWQLAHANFQGPEDYFPALFLGAPSVGQVIDADEDVVWGATAGRVADTPYYVHSVSSDPHLVTIGAPGRYALEVDLFATVTIDNFLSEDLEQDASFYPVTTGDGALASAGWGVMGLRYPYKHVYSGTDLDHTDGGTQSFPVSCHISGWFDYSDLTDGQIYIRAVPDPVGGTYPLELSVACRWRMMYLGGGK